MVINDGYKYFHIIVIYTGNHLPPKCDGELSLPVGYYVQYGAERARRGPASIRKGRTFTPWLSHSSRFYLPFHQIIIVAYPPS